MIVSKPAILIIFTFFVACLSYDSSAHAAYDPWPQTKLNHACFDLVWKPTEEEIANHKSRYGDGSNRITYTAAGPKGKPSVVSRANTDEPASMSTVRFRDKEALIRKPIVARVKTAVFIPENHGFNVGHAKMPLGIWGGNPKINSKNGGICATAGCPQSKQNGFSVRLTRNMLSEDNYGHGPRLYSYHMNRDGVKKWKNGVPYEYGEGIPMNTKFPLGRWFQLVMDISLNSFDQGEAINDGSMDLYMYSMNGTLVGEVHKDNLIFRKDPSWHIFGPLLSDLWGGPYKAETHLPRESFNTYYRGYRMYFLKEDKSLSQCKR